MLTNFRLFWPPLFLMIISAPFNAQDLYPNSITIDPADYPTVVIYLKNGQSWPAQIIGYNVLRRNIECFAFGEQREIDFDKVKSFILEREGKTANGLVVGAGLGCLAGSILGNAIDRSLEDDIFYYQEPFHMVVGGCLGAAAGGAVGALAGAGAGTDIRIHFDKMNDRERQAFLYRLLDKHNQR